MHEEALGRTRDLRPRPSWIPCFEKYKDLEFFSADNLGEKPGEWGSENKTRTLGKASVRIGCNGQTGAQVNECLEQAEVDRNEQA